MDKFYKIGNAIVSEGNIRTHSRIDTDGQFIVFTTYKIDAGSPENAKRALDAIARVIGAEDILASDADECGGEKPATAEPGADGWITWAGGECPVGGDYNVMVTVKFRDGCEEYGPARGFDWEYDGFEEDYSMLDIVAYRLVEEQP